MLLRNFSYTGFVTQTLIISTEIVYSIYLARVHYTCIAYIICNSYVVMLYSRKPIEIIPVINNSTKGYE